MDGRQSSQMRTGVLLIAIGVLFLAAEAGLWPVALGRVWPIVLIVIGVARIVFPGPERRRAGGWWLLCVGGIFALHTADVLSIRDSWPLFIVASGIAVVAAGLRPPARPEAR